MADFHLEFRLSGAMWIDATVFEVTCSIQSLVAAATRAVRALLPTYAETEIHDFPVAELEAIEAFQF